MSVLNLLLWSVTPLFGLAALLGMSRFERWLLEDGQTEDGTKTVHAGIVDTVTPGVEIPPAAEIAAAAGIAPAVAAQPVPRATPTAA